MPPNLIDIGHMEQKGDADCLAVCADMVLFHIGRRKPRWRLHRLLKIDPQYGTPFYNILNLRKLDVNVRFYERTTFGTIKRELARGNPCIVPVWADEFPYWPDERTQHAVVVVGADDENVWIHDPAMSIAPLPVPFGDFDLAWFGMNERLAVILP